MRPILTPEQVERLLAAAGGGITGSRNRALIALLYRAGLRPGEALALKPVDLDARKGTVYIESRSPECGQEVGLDDFSLGVLALWLEARVMTGLQATDPLFCVIGARVGVTGKAIDPSYLRRLMSRLGKAIALAFPLRAQCLRDTHAAELRAAGLTVHEIMRRLGRSSPRATERYLAELEPVGGREVREPATPATHDPALVAHRFVPGSI